MSDVVYLYFILYKASHNTGVLRWMYVINTIFLITINFRYWFCRHFNKYRNTTGIYRGLQPGSTNFYCNWETLTHWGRVTHICVSTLTTIGSHNGLSPGRRQAIIWTNAGILFIGPSETNFSEIVIGVFSFKKMYLKMSSAKGGHFVSASMC